MNMPISTKLVKATRCVDRGLPIFGRRCPSRLLLSVLALSQWLSLKANAQSVGFSFTGIIGGNNTVDNLGLFGPAGANLAGQNFSATITYIPQDFTYYPNGGYYESYGTQYQGSMTQAISINGKTLSLVVNYDGDAFVYPEGIPPPFNIYYGSYNCLNVSCQGGVGSGIGVYLTVPNSQSFSSPDQPSPGSQVEFDLTDLTEGEVLTGNFPAPVEISSPLGGQVYSLDDADGTLVGVDYTAQAASGDILWSAAFSYTSSGGVGPFTANDTFTSSPNVITKRSYTGDGGEIIVNATSGSNSAAPVVYYVAGSPTSISTADITNLLSSLYTSGTPQLLAHIAVKESSYCQFKTKVLNFDSGSVKAAWPVENYKLKMVPAGAYIGLMQVPNGMSNAFDWTVNATAGSSVFQAKLAAATRYQNAQIKKHGVKAFTMVQLEDQSLATYGGYAAKYYIPGIVDGSPQWILNPADSVPPNKKTPAATTYISEIRNNQIPTQANCK